MERRTSGAEFSLRACALVSLVAAAFMFLFTSQASAFFNPYQIAISPNGAQLYVGQTGDSYDALSRTAATGLLSGLGTVSFGNFGGSLSPHAIAVSANSAHVYSAGGQNSVRQANLSGGALTAGPSYTTNLNVTGMYGPTSVLVFGNNLYVISQGASSSGAVTTFTIDSTTGNLTFQATVAAPGIYNSTPVVSPDGKFLYAGSAVLARDTVTGALTLGADSGLVGRLKNAISPDGKFLYVDGGYGDPSISAYSRDAATGALSFVASVSNGSNGVSGLQGLADLAMSPDGQYLYAVARTDSSLVTFGRNSVSGALTFVNAIFNVTPGVRGLDGAQAVVASPDNKHVYVAAVTASAVAIFTRNSITGASSFVDAYPPASAPDTTITSAPASTTNSSSATFGFTSNQASASFECALDFAAWASCNSPKSYTGLTDGTHRLQVRAVYNGTADPTPASYTWNVVTQITTATASPSSYGFGDQAVGTVGPPRAVTVTNTGTTTLYVSRESLTGPNASDFIIASDNCVGLAIGVNQSCQVAVRFAPSAEASRAATLQIADNAPSSPQTVALSGNGIPVTSGGGGATGPPGPPGDTGPTGSPGGTGPSGTAGATGAAGLAGAAGAAGAAGSSGAPGTSGPTGAPGPQGKRGREPTIACKLIGAKRNRVRCSVTYNGTGAARATVRLSRNGAIYAFGDRILRRGETRIAMGIHRQMRRGTYKLTTTVKARDKRTVIVVGKLILT